MFTVHKPGLALVWKSQPLAVSVFFALPQPSGQIGRKGGNPCVLPSFRPRAAGREADRRARMFLASVLLEFEFFSGICQIQHFLSGSYYTETFLTGCIETLKSFSLKKKKKLGSWKLVIFCICVSTIILFTEVRAEN